MTSTKEGRSCWAKERESIGGERERGGKIKKTCTEEGNKDKKKITSEKSPEREFGIYYEEWWGTRARIYHTSTEFANKTVRKHHQQFWMIHVGRLGTTHLLSIFEGENPGMLDKVLVHVHAENHGRNPPRRCHMGVLVGGRFRVVQVSFPGNVDVHYC